MERKRLECSMIGCPTSLYLCACGLVGQGPIKLATSTRRVGCFISPSLPLSLSLSLSLSYRYAVITSYLCPIYPFSCLWYCHSFRFLPSYLETARHDCNLVDRVKQKTNLFWLSLLQSVFYTFNTDIDIPIYKWRYLYFMVNADISIWNTDISN